MWLYRQYYLGNLMSSIYHLYHNRFFLQHGTNTYVCSPKTYMQVSKLAETTVIRALLC